MKGLFKGAVGALLVGVAMCGPAIADGDENDRDNMDMEPQVAASGSDADKTIARAKGVMATLEKLCGDRFSFAAIRGDARKEMVKGMYGIIRDEKFREQGGKWRWRASCSANEAMNIVLDALKVQDTFGADQFMIVACPTQWAEGFPMGDGTDKLNDRVAKGLGEQVAKGMAEFLVSVRFRQTPAANNTENVARAAQNLGLDPQSASLAAVADQFGVPVVVSVQGTFVYEAWPEGDSQGSSYRGTIMCSAMSARIYHKASKTILAQFEIKMGRNKYLGRGMGSDVTADTAKMDQFPIGRVGRSESMRAVAEEYAQTVGLVFGKAMCKKLCDTFYANQTPTGGGGGGGAAAGPRKCPGCGDTIVSPDPKKCPACDSDLPAATGGGGGSTAGGGGFRNPNATDYYELQFVNWSGTGADEVVEALQGQKTGWGNFKEGDQVGKVRVFRCSFVGEMIVRQINLALEDCGKKSSCSVQKSGNTIIITKNQ